ncbi:response regulator transcription factor [Paenibacillus tengchongensis]|uniref:response regulator transcription factor n=1 Tax=Paenibacillus tengchongensis TaxID=2608684 RepID=UPI00124E9E5C|nr:response regulator [Paenibacillus tengchongensis]
MRTLVIVDDEPSVVNGLRKYVDWEALGIRLAGTADDGDTGLALIRELKPDIVLTDVQMPAMDGITMAAGVREALPGTKIVFISGHNDAEYLKSALQIHAADYVFKPVSRKELAAVLSRVTEALDAEERERQRVKEMQIKLVQSMPLLREKFLLSVISDSMAPEHIEEKLRFLGLPLRSSAGYIIMVIVIDDVPLVMDTRSERGRQLLSYTVLNIIQELIDERMRGVAFEKEPGEYVGILLPHPPQKGLSAAAVDPWIGLGGTANGGTANEGGGDNGEIRERRETGKSEDSGKNGDNSDGPADGGPRDSGSIRPADPVSSPDPVSPVDLTDPVNPAEPDGSPELELLTLAEAIRDSLRKYLKLSVTIGVGEGARQLSEAPASYRQAKGAADRKWYLGKNRILTMDNMEGGEHLQHRFAAEWGEKVIGALRAGNQEGLQSELNRIFAQLELNRGAGPRYAQNVSLHLILQSGQVLLELGGMSPEWEARELEAWKQVMQQETMRDLLEYTGAYLQGVCGFVQGKRSGKAGDIIERVRRLIEERYADNLTAADIAGGVFLSPTYVRLLFKQETGETLFEYLTKVRIDKAKQLLRDPQHKFYEVCYAVGYTDPSHFSKLFKKMTGSTPSAYRERYL